jgi:ankyrin repeat protein
VGIDGSCVCTGSSAVESLLKAIESADLAEVERLVGQDPGLLGARGSFDRTPLVAASGGGHVGVVRWLLDQGAAINQQNWAEVTALWCACRDGHLPIARLLLERGADPTTINIRRATPLIIASSEGHLEVVRFLLGHPSASTTINARDEKGQTARWRACWYGRGGWRGRCWRAGPIPPSQQTTASPPWPSPSGVSRVLLNSGPAACENAWRRWR